MVKKGMERILKASIEDASKRTPKGQGSWARLWKCSGCGSTDILLATGEDESNFSGHFRQGLFCPGPIVKVSKRTDLWEYFAKLRHDPKHHLGLGDIRLTMAQQQEVLDLATGVNPLTDDDLDAKEKK